MLCPLVIVALSKIKKTSSSLEDEKVQKCVGTV
jgi:hypothetical protein